jgi:hypothetical protein
MRFKTDNIQSPSKGEEVEVCCSAQSAYTDRQIPPFIEEMIPFLKHINV